MTEELEEALWTERVEPIVELVPVARGPVPRIVGPGRKERGYLARQAELAAQLARTTEELALAALCERGAQRAADRLECERDSAQDEAARLDAGQKRLLVALGAVQRENELLRERLALTEGRPAVRALPPPVREPRSPARGGAASQRSLARGEAPPQQSLARGEAPPRR